MSKTKMLNIEQTLWINSFFTKGSRQEIEKRIINNVTEDEIISVGQRSYVLSILKGFSDDELKQLQCDIPIPEGYILTT